MVATVAVETGIAPNDLLDAPPGVFEAIVDVLKRRADESRKRK
jgi:hypothetical protein